MENVFPSLKLISQRVDRVGAKATIFFLHSLCVSLGSKIIWHHLSVHGWDFTIYYD